MAKQGGSLSKKASQLEGPLVKGISDAQRRKRKGLALGTFIELAHMGGILLNNIRSKLISDHLLPVGIKESKGYSPIFGMSRFLD